jgi:hypothetical protein
LVLSTDLVNVPPRPLIARRVRRVQRPIGMARGVRPATARTLPGAANHIANAETTLQAIAIQNART